MGNSILFGFRKKWGMRVEWIDEQLRLRGMTRRQLAEGIGLSESQMSKVLSGSRRLTADEADEIRRFFGYRLPDDPVRSRGDLIEQYLAQLDVGQRHALALYLEALVGDLEEREQAS